MPTLATPANMRAFEAAHPRTSPNVEPQRAIAMSIVDSNETYSADSGDYWNRADDEPLEDSYGEPMILVVEQPASYWDALTGEAL